MREEDRMEIGTWDLHRVCCQQCFEGQQGNMMGVMAMKQLGHYQWTTGKAKRGENSV